LHSTLRSGRINIRAVIIIVAIVVAVGGGLAVAYKIRKQMIAEQALAAGMAAVDQAEWQTASRELRQYLTRYPDDAEVLHSYADATLKQTPLTAQDVGRAIRAYRRILRHRPGDDDVTEILARLYSHLGDFDEAVYVCRERLKAEPADPDARLWLARALVARNKPDEARPILVPLVVDQPDMIGGYELLAQIAAQADAVGIAEAQRWLTQAVETNHESAAAYASLAAFQRAILGDAEAARSHLSAAEPFEPEDPGIMLMIAEQWIAMNEPRRAAEALERLTGASDAAIRETFVNPAAFDMARFIAEARLALLRSQPAELNEITDRAIAQLPEPYRLAFLPAGIELLVRAGRIAEAREALDTLRDAIEASAEATPAQRESLALLESAVAEKEGRPHRVIELLESYVVRRPETAKAWRHLAMAYDRTGQRRRAIDALEQSLNAEPDNIPVLKSLARWYQSVDPQRAMAYARQVERLADDDIDSRLLRIETRIAGDIDGMTDAQVADIEDELRELKRSHADNARIDHVRARLAGARGRTDDAIAILKTRIAAADDAPAMRSWLAELLVEADRGDEAIAMCEAAAAARPEAAAPHILLARVQRDLGEADTAVRTLEDALASVKGDAVRRVKLALADLHGDAGRSDAAYALWRDVAEGFPRDITARLALLKTPQTLDDRQAAQQLIDDIRAIEGKAGLQWRFAQAEILLGSADPADQQRAADLLTRCVDADPGWSAPALALGQHLESTAQEQRAEQVYRRCLQANRSALLVADRLMDLLTRQQRPAEARAILDMVRTDPTATRMRRVQLALKSGDLEDATGQIESALAAAPDDPGLRVLLARVIYLGQGRLERAMALLDEARRLGGDRLTITDLQTQILRDAGRPQDALALLDDEIQTHDDFDAYLMRAKHHAATGDLAAAERDYRRLTAFEDKSAVGHHLLAMFYRDRGRLEDAVQHWQAALDAQPGNPAFQTEYIRTLLGAPNPDVQARGRQVLDDALAERPDDPALRSFRATLLMDSDPRAAAGILEDIVLQHPRRVTDHMQLIALALGRGDIQAAAQLTERALGNNPGQPELLLQKADIERMRKRPASARALVDQVLLRYPRNIRALLLASNLRLDGGDFADAEDYARRAIEAAPDQSITHVQLAQVLASAGKVDAALAAIASVSEPGVRTHITTADLRRMQGDYGAAHAELDAASELAPDHPDLAIAKLRVYRSQGDLDGMVETLKRYRRARPQDYGTALIGIELLLTTDSASQTSAAIELLEALLADGPRLIDGYRMLAQARYEQGDKEGFVAAARQILEIDPAEPQTLNNLAWVLSVELNRGDEALTLVERAVARFPADYHLRDTYGVVLHRAGRKADARSAFEACIRLTERAGTPDALRTQAAAHHHLGRLLADEGDTEQAVTHLRRALQIDDELHCFDRQTRDAIEDRLGSAGN